MTSVKRRGRNFPEGQMITMVTLPLNEKEYKRLQLLADSKDMSEQQLLIQGLRLYDAVEAGDIELVWKNDKNFYKDDLVDE